MKDIKLAKRQFTQRTMVLAVAAVAAGIAAPSAMAQLPIAAPYESPLHVFSIDDLQAGFDGSTYGTSGTYQDADAICGLPGGATCPSDVDPATGELLVKPWTDKQGVILYPVDTEFGFEVADFLGAVGKTREGTRDYQEGYVGNITEAGEVIGVKVSNAATDTYKVQPPMGTWCQGLGGTSVKCSTEHYTVMEHTLSCHEVIPYRYADPDDATQLVQELPDGKSFNCADAELDDLNLIVGDNGLVPAGTPLTDFTPGLQIHPNDNTTVLTDIAVSSDYSITLKDDGKALYRWGSLIKRPNDIRFYARIPLPEEWKVPGADYEIQSAKLVVTHWITNNPNDQLRPEDLENEAATGRKPSYRVDGGSWVSTKPCFEGDGDFIDSEEGSADPDAIDAGTLFKNASTAYIMPAGANPPAPDTRWSSDLVGKYTNAFYTTIDRDPFEWSYVSSTAVDEFNFVGTALPLTPEEMEAQGLELVSGPRWRLKANKFGQDIPGLEIPLIECSAPPFGHDNIKYEVGTPVTTVINLLDWDESEGPSPLATSKGWVDVAQNGFVETVETENGPVSTNGLPMTDDLDLAVYIKGDRKPTALYSARLVINEHVDIEPLESDLSISSFKVPDKVNTDRGNILVSAVVSNDTGALAAGEGTLDVIGIADDGLGTVVGSFSTSFSGIEPGKKQNFQFRWGSPSERTTVNWTATLTAGGEVVSTATGSTLVRNKGS